ncbi:MAG: hypothetical protein CM1200mP30_10020 [Pseudomonadota bacterium]|nr:MAG: hypothetical protein CM1200mP30_10020 [Pseudomonadota bacterium]
MTVRVLRQESLRMNQMIPGSSRLRELLVLTGRAEEGTELLSRLLSWILWVLEGPMPTKTGRRDVGSLCERRPSTVP